MIPYSEELWQLYLCSFITGLGYGVYFNSNNVWILELFSDKAGPILQLSGFIYGIGTILGPLLYQPYVTGEIQTQHDFNQFSAFSIDENLIIFDDNQTEMANNQTYYLTLNSNESSIADNGMDDGLRRSKLKIPFMVCGIIAIIGKSKSMIMIKVI